MYKIYHFNHFLLYSLFSGIKNIHIVGQPPLPSVSRTFSPSPSETPYPLNNNSPFPSLAPDSHHSTSMHLITLSASYLSGII